MFHNHRMPASVLALMASGARIETKEAGEPLEILTKSFGDHTKTVLEKLGATKTQMDAFSSRMTDIEQKMARRTGGAPERVLSFGEQVAAADQIKALAGETTRGFRTRVEIKTTITGSNGSTGSAGALNPAQRDNLVALPQRRMTIRDLLPVIQVTQGSVEYPRQSARSLNAGMVAENPSADKPESDMTFELKTVPIRTIAHWTRASRQILDDAPQLAGVIDTELLYGLELKEEQQLLTGDGTGQNIAGMMPAATAYAAPTTIANANIIDILGLAMLQCALAEFSADGIVLHPSDWLRIKTLKDAGGNYILWGGNGGQPSPQTVVPQSLFGVPVVTTQAMAANNFLVGNFQQAATLYDRWEARTELSTEDGDNFRRNLVTILAEERVGLAVKQPLALVKGTFPV